MKRLIICCDGTWSTSEKGDVTTISNVARLSRMIDRQGRDEAGNLVPQIVYYQSGFETGSLDMVSWVVQGMLGIGLEEDVTTAYHFLATNYSPGDEIFTFGYSRGAYTARVIASLVTEMGVLKSEELHRFRRAYQLYRDHGDTAARREDDGHEMTKGTSFWRRAQALKSHAELEEIDNLKNAMHRKLKVKVVGVWDTVGTEGIPDSLVSTLTSYNDKYKFHDTALNSRIENAFQALAIDEHRGAFKPTLWHLDPKYGTATNLKQCWFPGFHETIGGGNTMANLWVKDRTDIDEVSLAWMCDQVDGLVAFNEKAIDAILGKEDCGKATWATGKAKDMTNLVFKLDVVGGDHVRTPGQYNKNLEWEKRDTDDHEKRSKHRDYATNETIHPSVKHRQDVFAFAAIPYHPSALKEHYGWLRTRSPAWTWQESKTEKGGPSGDGARWIRPSVPRCSNWIWPSAHERKVELEEWVIREVPGKINFEARLLPTMVKCQLDQRNKNRLQGTRCAFWSRSTFPDAAPESRTNGTHDGPDGHPTPPSMHARKSSVRKIPGRDVKSPTSVQSADSLVYYSPGPHPPCQPQIPLTRPVFADSRVLSSG